MSGCSLPCIAFVTAWVTYSSKTVPPQRAVQVRVVVAGLEPEALIVASVELL